MNKFGFSKKKLENTWTSGKEKVNEQIQTVKGKDYGKVKIAFFILLFIILIGTGFYFNIIQNIFYSFLSIIVIVLVLALGVAWQYIVFTYVPLCEFQRTESTSSNSWKELEKEFEILKINSEQNIKQLQRYTILNYMTSIGLFVFSCIILLIDWMYGRSSSPSPYQEINPAIALSAALIFFSLLFMLLYYINQREINKKQEKLFATERWVLSIKSAHLLGKDSIIEELLSGKASI